LNGKLVLGLGRGKEGGGKPVARAKVLQLEKPRPREEGTRVKKKMRREKQARKWNIRALKATSNVVVRKGPGRGK